MSTNSEKSYQERILKVQIHIQNHLNDELTLESLAAIAHFSPYHFHRIFSAYTGESVKSYLRRLRVERASRDLLFTDLSLTQISERAGYDTQQSFHRAFKEYYSITPTEFRERKQDSLISHVQKNYASTSIPAVEIKKTDAFHVAFVRHIGSYDDILEAWMHLANEVGITNLLSDQTKRISIPYDAAELTPVDKFRYDACITLDAIPDFKPSGKVGIQEIKGGKYAVITHHGPVEKIESTYQILFGLWLPQSGYEPDDQPNFMLHRSTPFIVQPDKLITDIYLPIK
jgi:AraC family transcriptional regulator